MTLPPIPLGHALSKYPTPVSVMWMSFSRRGHPATASVSHSTPATEPAPAIRAAVRCRSGVVSFETITADCPKQGDAIDAGTAGRFGDVAAGGLEQLGDVVTFETL